VCVVCVAVVYVCGFGVCECVLFMCVSVVSMFAVGMCF